MNLKETAERNELRNALKRASLASSDNLAPPKIERELKLFESTGAAAAL